MANIWPDACPLDFGLDGSTLYFQPGEVRVIEPQPTIKRTTGGGVLAAPRRQGRRFVCRWGDEALQVGAVSELWEALVDTAGLRIQINHTLSVILPDGRIFTDVPVHLVDAFEPVVQRPGSFEPMTLTFQETP